MSKVKKICAVVGGIAIVGVIAGFVYNIFTAKSIASKTNSKDVFKEKDFFN